MNINKKKLYILDIILFFILIAGDQLTKYFATLKLKGSPSYNIIDGWLEFHYHQNSGAAWGMLEGQKILFVLIAAVFLAIALFVIVRTPADKKYTKLHILLVFISAGAIGNMIDRVRLDYVVDFIYFSIINFPIFNVADIYVTCSTILLIIVLIFGYKDDKDFAFLSLKSKKNKDMDS